MTATGLTMQTDTLRVMVLPECGGKIASIRWIPEDLELLQPPLASYAPRTMTMGFDDSDASGFDECLPSVAACALETPAGIRHIPDHGDFWRLPWRAEQDANAIRMTATGESLPLRFERRLTLHGDVLGTAYQVTNFGDADIPYAWSAHPLFAVDRGDRVDLPGSVKEVTVEGSAANRLGPKPACHAWPHTQSTSGESIDLSIAGGPEDGIGDKLFAAAPPEGWAAVERLRHGLRIEVQFDARRSPWLGLWLCYGGWPENKPRRQQCVAIEPCTAPVDSLAEAAKNGSARTLAPGQSDEWGMQIRVTHIS